MPVISGGTATYDWTKCRNQIPKQFNNCDPGRRLENLLKGNAELIWGLLGIERVDVIIETFNAR